MGIGKEIISFFSDRMQSDTNIGHTLNIFANVLRLHDFRIIVSIFHLSWFMDSHQQKLEALESTRKNKLYGFTY